MITQSLENGHVVIDMSYEEVSIIIEIMGAGLMNSDWVDLNNYHVAHPIYTQLGQLRQMLIEESLS